MAGEMRPIPNAGTSEVVATPEGDNEILPEEPLQPSADAAVSGLEVPRGNKPDDYRRDHP